MSLREPSSAFLKPSLFPLVTRLSLATLHHVSAIPATHEATTLPPPSFPHAGMLASLSGHAVDAFPDVLARRERHPSLPALRRADHGGVFGGVCSPRTSRHALWLGGTSRVPPFDLTTRPPVSCRHQRSQGEPR